MQEETLGGSTQKEGDTKEGAALMGSMLRLLELSLGSHAPVLLFSSKQCSNFVTAYLPHLLLC